MSDNEEYDYPDYLDNDSSYSSDMSSTTSYKNDRMVGGKLITYKCARNKKCKSSIHTNEISSIHQNNIFQQSSLTYTKPSI